MARTLKSKLTLGLGFLFFVIVALSGTGAYFLLRLSRSTAATVQDNYRSVAYARQMTDALADLRDARPAAGTLPGPAYRAAQQRFLDALGAEQHNITEPGEQALADSLAAGFRAFGTTAADAAGYQQLRGQITRVAQLNLRAIEQQSARTRTLAARTIGTLGMLAAAGILATLSFLFSFPDYLTRPVEELAAGIRRMSAGDYAQRLPVRANDEFAPVAEAFNDLARRLEGYETADGTPRVDNRGPLDVVTIHQRPGTTAAGSAPVDGRQLRLVEQLREQARQLQHTAAALLDGQT